MESQQPTGAEQKTLPTSRLPLPVNDGLAPKPARKLNGSQRRRISPLAAFFVGLLVGIIILVTFVLLIGQDRPLISTPPSAQGGSIIVQISNTYITQIIEKQLKAAGIPGTITNVQVEMKQHDTLLIVTGDDKVGIAIMSITEHFSLTLQPYISGCQLKIRIIHANFGRIPVTGYAATFEDDINHNLQLKTSDLPKGFTYCATNVRAEPKTMFITYSATPT